MRCKYQNINIMYIYLNAYLCFYFSVSFAFPLLFQWIFFSCLSKVVLLFTSRWNRCFFLCLSVYWFYMIGFLFAFVVCFSFWLLGFYVFIYLIKYVYAFLFGFIAFWLLAFLFYCLQILPFFSSNAVFWSYTFVSFYAYFFYFVLLFICLCHYLNVQIVNYKDI